MAWTHADGWSPPSSSSSQGFDYSALQNAPIKIPGKKKTEPPPPVLPPEEPGPATFNAPEQPAAAAPPSMQALAAPNREAPMVDRGGPGINPNAGRRVPPMSMRVLMGRLY